MRTRKLLKISAITLATLALLILFLVAFFLFNPFEGALTEMRDVVPRGVDFFVHKANLREDFTMPDGSVDSDRFPYVPSLEKVGNTPAWVQLRRGSWYQDLGITNSLQTVRQEFQKLRKDASFIHLVDDIIGKEAQVAGYFGRIGFRDARWCLYTRVSWRGKAAFGAMAQSFVREQMSAQGLVLGDDPGGEFYTLKIPRDNLSLFLARHRDCLMVSNDEKLLTDSLKLANGNRDLEPLGPSAHYRDGVLEPLLAWRKQTGVIDVNAAEWHLRPDQLFPKLPQLHNWPNANNDENRNEKILASFVNLPSYRFLSGSVIFEPFSLSFLSHLVVNHNTMTAFQKSLFDGEAIPRKLWMNDFFSMVPREACGAAALKMPAGEFIREMFQDGLVQDERDEINRAIRATRKYKGMDDLIDKIGVNLQPRVGVVLRPNRRSEDSKANFQVPNESPFPQAAWVFWVRKHRRSNRVLNDGLKELINHINENRRAYAIANAFKLGLAQGGVTSDVAYEFAIPMVPGTGSIAMATVGEYFIVANSGPFIYSMVQSMVKGNSRRGESDFQEFVNEMPEAVNGVVFAWSDQLAKVAEDFEQFSKTVSGPVDQAWAVSNRPRAEQETFRRPRWRRYGTRARIPADEKEAFEAEVDATVSDMWRRKKASDVVADTATLRQFREFVGTFRSAYLQMVLTESSLQVWGRVLAPEYGRR